MLFLSFGVSFEVSCILWCFICGVLWDLVMSCGVLWYLKVKFLLMGHCKSCAWVGRSKMMVNLDMVNLNMVIKKPAKCPQNIFTNNFDDTFDIFWTI